MVIETFINTPVPSSTYLVVEDGNALLIDPGSKDSSTIINRIKELNVDLDYIILTHDHFDHVWGVNSIKKEYGCKVICSSICAEKLKIPKNYFNLLYFGDPSPYSVEDIEIIVQDGTVIIWRDHKISFIMTPGHSSSSMCISIENYLFSGDTIMKGYKPLILKRHDGSKEQFKFSVQRILTIFSSDTKVYPGHGESFDLGSAREELLSYR